MIGFGQRLDLALRYGGLTFLVFAGQISTQGFVPFTVCVISSLERAGRSEVINGSREAKVFAARGEYEAFQIVIRAPQGGVRDVRVTSSDLTGPGRQVIARDHVAAYMEHYVHVREPSPDWKGRNRSRGAGWYPDALIPIELEGSGSTPSRRVPWSIPEETNQPLWVDIFVPRDTLHGIYQGTIHISASSGAVEVPVSVSVWDFTLPLRPSLKSSFGYWSPTREGIEELLKHRIMPQRLTAANCSDGGCAGLMEAERDWMERLGLSMTDVGLWSGADHTNCSMTPPPVPGQLRAAVSAHAQGLFLFTYAADEVKECRNLYPLIKTWGRTLRQAGIKHLVVIEPTAELLDDGSGTGRSAVDIWVVLPKTYEAAGNLIDGVLKKGDEIWSYNTLSQDPYSPKWLIDYEPINFRIQAGFLGQSLGLTGLLYWRIDRWRQGAWDDVNNIGEFAAHGNYPGEGMLVYAGAALGFPGILPSIRLKQIREGIEDYEYVEQLKQLGRGEWALDVIRRVAPDWRNWSHDRAALEATRRDLGEEIHRLRLGAGASSS